MSHSAERVLLRLVPEVYLNTFVLSPEECETYNSTFLHCSTAGSTLIRDLNTSSTIPASLGMQMHYRLLGSFKREAQLL